MQRTAGVRVRAARWAVGAAAALVLGALPAGASTVRSVSVGEMLSGAGLVFDGVVTGLRSEEPLGPASIRTCATFEVLEVLKGPAVSGPLELCFAGGRMAGMGRRVAGVTLPQVGERGFYFVEDLDQPLVHPLYGWSQGHFRVAPGPVEVVTTEDGQPVVGLDADGPHPGGPSHGVARGARVARPGSRDAATALDATAFRARVRALLKE